MSVLPEREPTPGIQVVSVEPFSADLRTLVPHAGIGDDVWHTMETQDRAKVTIAYDPNHIYIDYWQAHGSWAGPTGFSRYIIELRAPDEQLLVDCHKYSSDGSDQDAWHFDSSDMQTYSDIALSGIRDSIKELWSIKAVAEKHQQEMQAWLASR